MIKTNYSFEKRQRDLRKKAKQDAKRARKLGDKDAPADTTAPAKDPAP